MKEDDNELTVQQLSEDELVAIIGALATGVYVCPQCGGTDVVATLQIPPTCCCRTCHHIWQEGGFTSCGVNCQPGCKSRCLSGGKK